MTVLAGVLFVLLALLRMGWMSQFLSKAVVKGFLFGAALEVTVGELPKLTGTIGRGHQHMEGVRELDQILG